MNTFFSCFPFRAVQAWLAAALLVLPLGASEFKPGEVWLDTSGHPIQAHGGGVLVRGDTYYWYGEDKTLGNMNKTGISCYSSTNLYDWKHVGVVLPKEAMPPQFQDRGVVERPKVLYNARTRKYLMWMHLDDRGYHAASAGVATADSPAGPFVFLRQIRPIQFDAGYKEADPDRQKELGGTYRDMNLFLDSDGKAYAFYASEGNATMYVVQLNEDFTGPQTPTEQGRTWARIRVGEFQEAPAPFKYGNRYYLITSHCTGWAPNPASYAVADRILGPWEVRGNPCVGADAQTTFRSQSTYVLPVVGKPGCFIFMADRWSSKSLQDSRYVWLPLILKPDGSFTLEWRDKWDLSVFDGKN